MTNPENPESEAHLLSTRLADFETGLRAMQEVIRNLPDADQAERAIAVDSRLDRIGRMVALGIVCLLVLIGLLIYRLYDANKNNEVAQKGIKCIVEQLEEHRNANKSAHMAFAEKLDAPYVVDPINQPRAIPLHLEENCAPFSATP